MTAFYPTYGESAPSNEALVATSFGPPVRWLDIHVGRGRSIIKDHKKSHRDRLLVRGSYAVIDVDSAVPTVLNDADPRADGITIQVRAPGNLVLVNIPANDPRWKVSKRGIYRWKTKDSGKGPVSYVRIDTRKSEFRLMSKKNDFGPVLLSAITVSLSCQNATGSETRVWNNHKSLPAGTRAKFTLAR